MGVKDEQLSSRKSKPGGKPQNGWESTFIQCELDKAQKDLLKAREVDVDALWGALEDLIDDGYKFSISRDDRNDCTAAFLSSPAGDDGKRKYTLSARGPGAVNALQALCYKHFEVLAGEWGTPGRDRSEKDPWG